jgi:hypothetical protein
MKYHAERKNREMNGRWLWSGMAEQRCKVVKGSPVIARSAEGHLLRFAL